MSSPAPSDWACSWPVEPRRVSHWTEGSTRATVLELSDHVMGFEMVGHVPKEAVPFLIEAFETLFARSDRAYLFFDDEALDSYDSEIRDELVDLVRTRRSHWNEIYILTQSALLGMTIATVGLMLGRKLHSYRSREKFMAAVERALAATSSD